VGGGRGFHVGTAFDAADYRGNYFALHDLEMNGDYWGLILDCLQEDHTLAVFFPTFARLVGIPTNMEHMASSGTGCHFSEAVDNCLNNSLTDLGRFEELLREGMIESGKGESVSGCASQRCAGSADSACCCTCCKALNESGMGILRLPGSSSEKAVVELHFCRQAPPPRGMGSLVEANHHGLDQPVTAAAKAFFLKIFNTLPRTAPADALVRWQDEEPDPTDWTSLAQVETLYSTYAADLKKGKEMSKAPSVASRKRKSAAVDLAGASAEEGKEGDHGGIAAGGEVRVDGGAADDSDGEENDNDEMGGDGEGDRGQGYYDFEEEERRLADGEDDNEDESDEEGDDDDDDDDDDDGDDDDCDV
jgi:hypothetical protein